MSEAIGYFKIGDSFSVPMQLFDTETNQGIEITLAMTITCRLVNSVGTLVSDCVITPYPDQVTDKGWFTISVLDTTQWTVGVVTGDVKVEIDGSIKHSDNFCFNVVKSITP
jgi:hypothetical protein